MRRRDGGQCYRAKQITAGAAFDESVFRECIRVARRDLRDREHGPRPQRPFYGEHTRLRRDRLIR